MYEVGPSQFVRVVIDRCGFCGSSSVGWVRATVTKEKQWRKVK